MDISDPVRHVRALLDPKLDAVLDSLAPLAYGWAPGAESTAFRAPGHVRGASSIRRMGGRMVILQDDVNVLVFHHERGRSEGVFVPVAGEGRNTLDPGPETKQGKMDLEACAALPDGRLVAFGSGSASRRERLVVVGTAGPPLLVEGGGLYAMLRRTEAFSGSELNVEGVVVVGEALRLFQRGNGAPGAGRLPVNATGDLPLADFLRWLDEGGPVPGLMNIVQYDLGDADGVPFSFTDAAVMPDDRVAFLACAEASPDTYRDGPVLGCRVGFLAAGQARLTDIRRSDGSPVTLKLEGLEVRPGAPGTFDVVADPDLPDEPALMGRLIVREVPPEGSDASAFRRRR